MQRMKNPALVASTTGVSRAITLRHNYNITPEVQRQTLSIKSRFKVMLLEAFCNGYLFEQTTRACFRMFRLRGA